MSTIEVSSTQPAAAQAARYPTPVHQQRSRLRTAVVGDVVVVAPQGVFDQGAAESLDKAVPSAHGAPVVLDLSDCTLRDPAWLRTLTPDRWGRRADSICVACSRLTGRQVLALSGVARRFALFQRTEDALQSRILDRAGYGPGWDAPTASLRL